MANDAIHANPYVGTQRNITTHGSNWLWAVTAVMLFTDLIVLSWHFMIPRGQRIFHQIGIVSYLTIHVD